jgi:hypothetical protein
MSLGRRALTHATQAIKAHRIANTNRAAIMHLAPQMEISILDYGLDFSITFRLLFSPSSTRPTLKRNAATRTLSILQKRNERIIALDLFAHTETFAGRLVGDV